MKKATFQEYTEAKKEIMSGGECKEYASTDEYGRNHKTICCENGEAFWEVTENDVTEFWSTKHPDSRKYEAERELATNVGTNMEEVDYKELAGTCDWNYFRFDVCDWQYEYENGTLRFYNN